MIHSDIFAWLVKKSPHIQFYTYISDVFKNMPEEILKYDWLLSHYECNYYPEPLKFNKDVFIDGSCLSKIINTDDEPQFIWGILSSVKIGERFDIRNNKIYSDGNIDIWKSKIKMQNANSEIEITCWDSTCFIFMTTKPEISAKFKNLYSEAISLKYYSENISKREEI